jgi:hypothetical protein
LLLFLIKFIEANNIINQLFYTISVCGQITPLDFVNPIIFRTSVQKYKVSIAIMISQGDCKLCIAYINPIYESKFNNIEVDMKIYFRSDNIQLMDDIVKENGGNQRGYRIL